MLSVAAISCPQLMQAERPSETERRSGTREAMTLRKLPIGERGKREHGRQGNAHGRQHRMLSTGLS